MATLSDLEAVAVDGEPFVTKGPDAGWLACYRARPRAAQRGLPFAGPRTGATPPRPRQISLALRPATGRARPPPPSSSGFRNRNSLTVTKGKEIIAPVNKQENIQGQPYVWKFDVHLVAVTR